MPRDHTATHVYYWPVDNITNRLTYGQFRAIMDIIANQRRDLEDIIKEAIENLIAEERNEPKIRIANNIIRKVKQKALSEYQTAYSSLRPLRLTIRSAQVPYMTFDVVEMSAVAVVKDVIQKQTGEFPENQVLSLRGRELQDSDTLKQHLVTKDTPLYLQIRGRGEGFDVFVQGLWKLITVTVTRSMKVDDFRRKVANAEGLQVDNVALDYNGERLLDGNTLGYYGIQMNSTIILSRRTHGG